MVLALLLLYLNPAFTNTATAQTPLAWQNLPTIEMKGGLGAFWNVVDRSKGENGHDAQAQAHGLRPVTILNTFSDYPGAQKESIELYLGKNPVNPWKKPSFFQPIIRRNIALAGTTGTFVHDIEFDFEQDIALAWANPEVRTASGITDPARFEEAYYAEWATWYWQPLAWTKELYPTTSVGIYGPQPFRRDYWGIVGKNAKQIDGTHQNDYRLWKYIDQYVDFYIASIYVFYPTPDSVYYMAANIEENYQRTRQLSKKPLYAYQWLRYHEANKREANREVDDYLVEAMAILPYFSGARANVLWGYEPQINRGTTPLYANLALYLTSLARVAKLSPQIGQGKLEIEQAAHILWNRRRPLIRKITSNPNECVVMAINPWQSDTAETRSTVKCGNTEHAIVMQGRKTTLVHIVGQTIVPF